MLRWWRGVFTSGFYHGAGRQADRQAGERNTASLCRLRVRCARCGASRTCRCLCRRDAVTLNYSNHRKAIPGLVVSSCLALPRISNSILYICIYGRIYAACTRVSICIQYTYIHIRLMPWQITFHLVYQISFLGS